MKRFVYLLPFVLLAACDGTQEATPCTPYPPAGHIKLRFISSADGSDLLTTNALHRDSLRATQPCSTDSLLLRFKDYPQPGTGTGITVLEFLNLHNPTLDDQPECFKILLKWTATDTDTLEWYYHKETDPDGCSSYPIDNVYFNGQLTTDTFDGYFRYWTCVK